MKRQQNTKVESAAICQSSAYVATPKRIVSSLRQVLCHNSISQQSFAQAVLYGVIAATPLSLLSMGIQASELDVYEQGGASSDGGPVITMMLDNTALMGGPLTVQKGGGIVLPDFRHSGSSNFKINTYAGREINSIHLDYAADYPECAEKSGTVGVKPPNATSPNDKIYPSVHNYKMIGFTATIKQENKPDRSISFELEACPLTAKDSKGNTQYRYTRLGRLKLGMVSLLADSIVINDGSNRELPVYKDIINGGFSVGLGQYPILLGEAQTGRMVVPAAALTVSHRINLVENIVATKPSGLIPTANAYAEAGAYMLGTKTATIETGIRYEFVGASYYSRGRWEYDRCVGLETAAATNAIIYVRPRADVYLCERGGRNTIPSTAEELERLSDFSVSLSDVNSTIKNSVAGARKLYFKEITSWASNLYSGMTASSADTKNEDGTEYISPIRDGQTCSANGIYLMSSGKPIDVFKLDTYNDRRYSVIFPMNESLENVLQEDSSDPEKSTSEQVTRPFCNSGLEDERAIPEDDRVFRGWSCIGEYAQKLNNKNLKKGALRTAFVGFGRDFRGVNDTNCDAAPNLNAKNACKLGSDAKNSDRSYKYNYGQGGFYHVETSEEIAQSFISFANSLLGDYTPQAGEGPSIAIDPTDSTDNRSFAYLPIMLPSPGSSNLLWTGNLKKYNIKNGTLFDAKDKPLYSRISGDVNKDSFGLWNKTTTADGGSVLSGGMFAKLVGPNTSNLSSLRNVFVEKSTNGQLAKIAVNGTTPTGIQDLGYNLQRQHYLLNFLGYNKVPVFSPNKVSTPITDDDYKTGGGYEGTTKPMENITEYAPTNAVKILGGTNNSKPQEILYKYTSTPSSTAGAAPTVTESYKVLYGSMDGALHLVNASTGVEDWAFIPNVVVKDNHQVAALKENSKTTANGLPNSASNVAYGVDAPWYVTTSYNRSYDTASGKTTVEPSAIRAYGGLGRGGEGFYGLDITDTSSPSILFHIDSNTSGFTDLGRTWTKPVSAVVGIKVVKKDKDGKVEKDLSGNPIKVLKPKEVLFVSGGYDMCYDIPSFMLDSTNPALIQEIKNRGMESECLNTDQDATKNKAKGSALYMIDPENGNLLWTAKNTNMKHSIAGEVSVVYADNDEYADVIYFADLGGQVFRVDLDGTKGYNEKSGSKSLWAKRVVRILDASTAGKPALRFFQRPIPSSYSVDSNNNVVKRGGKLFEVVSVASGDRNNPLSKLSDRQATATPNKVISIWDVDVTKDNILTLADTELSLKTGSKEGVTLSELEKMDWSGSNTGLTNDQKNNIRTGAKFGWYDDLTYFSGANSAGESTIKSVTSSTSNADAVGNNVNYLKVISQPNLRAGRLYVPVYNRMAYIAAAKQCAPAPTGVSEAHEYCLPFGVCSSTTKNSSGADVVEYKRGQTYVLGSGIGAVTIASGEGTNRAHIITPEQVKSDGDSGEDGKTVLETVKDAFYSLYNLIPNEWFERRPVTNSSTPASSSNSSGGSSNGES